MNQRLLKISKTRKRWHNATRNVEVTPLRFFQPQTKEDLIEIVREAEKNNLKVRAVGAGHSFSEAAKCQDFLVEMFRLDKVQQYDQELLKKDNRGGSYVKAQAGIRIKALNKALNKLGLALPNMGAFDWQTISGALSTGTHGTGLKQPAIPDMVRSVILVGAEGKMMQIEPSGGITDPAKFEGGTGVELIQDDEKYYSAVLSLGGFGLIYELVLEVKPAFWMEEVRMVVEWEELERQLLDGTFMKMVENIDFVSARINPFAVKDRKSKREVHNCLVVCQRILTPEEARQPRSLNARLKNLKAKIFGFIPAIPWIVVQFLNVFPKQTPGAINSALKSTKDVIYRDKSYKVLYQSAVNLRKRGISSEFAFPVQAELIVDIIRAIFKQAETNRLDGNLYQSSYIPIRFVPASDAFLSPCYQHPRVFIDVPLLRRTKGDREILDRYQKLMMEKGGVPHWGKINYRLYDNFSFIKEKYPKVKTWIRVREEMDPNGTFSNEFIRHMGLMGETPANPV